MRRSAPIVVMVMGMILTLHPTPAFAHQPDLTGEVACAGYANRHQMVTWTLSNSEWVVTNADGARVRPVGDTGQGRTMTLRSVAVTSGRVSGFERGQKYPTRPQEYSTRTAVTDLPGDQTGSVTLDVRADWKGEDGPRNVAGTVTVYLTGRCKMMPSG